ncbi:MAG: class I SAM-dependent methyltransferase [Nitrospira sp.]|nr:class I SAM-dependent methyltransferase [Nitrospira sp.]HNP30238.1 class I SAM-dependent methyltransferase [Nitrospirales bacterium]
MFIPTIPLSGFFPGSTSEIQKLAQGTSDLISTFSKKGGPDPTDYPILNTLLQQFSGENIYKIFSDDQLHSIRSAFGDALSPETIQGWAYHKPLGYAGDYQIIEKIYNFHTSSNPHLAKWDKFFHTQKAPKAVRNRLSFFLDHLWKTKMEAPSTSHILNLASGPGRDMYEALKVLGRTKLEIDCVDQDIQAINYAKNLCRDFLNQIHFSHKNVFRFSPTKTYDMIWSAGLFDYFNDNIFKRALKKFFTFLKPNGKMVIGNFTVENPSRGYMELFKWDLFHRSNLHLRRLAQECGFTENQIHIEQEPEEVNLFLVITKN